MAKFYLNEDEVEVCKKDVCVRAKGEHADWISVGAVFLLLALGVSALIAALR